MEQTRMPRVEAILQDERFRYGVQRIDELEQQRIFCCHGLEHLLDVARIAWIMVLEQQLALPKDLIYGAALLHDLGRYRQYEAQIPHHQASAELAAEILPAAGYTVEETATIIAAIRQHSTDGQTQEQQLACLLYQADKLSRNCFQCAARQSCKWPEEKRNKTILY